MSDDLGSRSSVRSLRDITGVNYRSLHQGESQLSDMADKDVIGKSAIEESADTITPQGASGGRDKLHSGETLQPRFGFMSDGDTDLEILAMEREMQQLKEEKNRLKRATQKDTLRRQLEAQRQKVQNLRGRTLVHNSDKSDDKKSGKKQSSERSRLSASREISVEHEIDMETIEQLRSDSKLRHTVQKQLKEHGLLSDMSSTSSDSDSSSYFDDSDDSKSEKKSKKKRSKHKKKSGINAKASDKVRHPQKWPHAHLQYEHVNKQVKFDDLDFKLFIAGKLEIISEESLASPERKGRLQLLKKIVYYYSTYEFEGLKAFYAAWLREIELGKKSWDDDSQQIENAILSKYLLKGSINAKFRSSKSGGKSSSKQVDEDRTWFCSAFQRNKCPKKSNHLDTFNGSLRLQSHICATCWLKDKAKLEHPECSSSCPRANH